MQELRKMRIRQVSLVDKGANGVTIALLKRDAADGRGSARAIRKDVPTFASLNASREIQSWLPGALASLGEVINAAIAPSDDPAVTPDLRLDAVRGSAAQFTDQLLQLVATAIVGQAPVADVAKHGPSPFRGLM